MKKSLIPPKKILIVVFAIMGFVCIVNSTSVPVDAIKHTDGFCIYFIENKKDNSDPNGGGFKTSYNSTELKAAIFGQKPIIELNNLNAYEWHRHYLYLNKKSWERLYSFINFKKRKSYEVFFVVQVNHEPIYYGFFVSTIWSGMISRPYIFLEFFKEKRNNQGSFSFPIYYFDIQKTGRKDPRYSEEVFNSLNRNQKIVYYDHPSNRFYGYP